MLTGKAGVGRLAFLALLVFAAPFKTATAHASLISSSPPNGAHVHASPSSIRLVFSEPLVANLGHVSITGPDGREQKLDVSGDPHEVRALIASLPTLSPGAYSVAWHVVSADGHPVSGGLAFHVGEATGPAPAAPAAAVNSMTDDEPMFAGAAVSPALFRGLALSALLAMCGLLGFTAYSNSPDSGRQYRVIGWLSAIATILLLAHLAAWMIHISPGTSLDSDVIRASLSQRVGADELVRLVLTALAAWAILLARRPRLAFAFALAAVISGGTIGHPAAMHPVIAIPLKSFHLVGVSFWIGGVLWLLMLDKDSRDAVTAASTVSGVALASITIVAITGVLETVLFLNSWSDLIRSSYGITILAKVAGLLGLAAFGVYHRSSVRRGIVDARLRRSMRFEIMLMIAVVMTGGFLAYVPTPMQH